MSDRQELTDSHTRVIQRHWRSLVDSEGRPGRPLLDELAAIADDHARSLDDEHRSETVPVMPVVPEAAAPKADPVTPIAARTKTTAARTAPPRRQPARRNTK